MYEYDDDDDADDDADDEHDDDDHDDEHADDDDHDDGAYFDKIASGRIYINCQCLDHSAITRWLDFISVLIIELLNMAYFKLIYIN